MAKAKRDAGPTFTEVDTELISLDAKNPRLGVSKATNQDRLREILLKEPHYAMDLVESFVENGFIKYEPLIVREEGEGYVVIEGNRRLAAVKHILRNEEEYPANVVKDLERVPVLIFHENPDESHLREIRTYLGVRHLQGYREWPAESKAIFLDRNIPPGTDLKKLKSEFGIEKREITRFLIPYRVRKYGSKLLENLDLGDDPSFWILGEALGRSDIKEYIQLKVSKTFQVESLDKRKFKYLIEFLYGSKGTLKGKGSKRISDTRQLTRLGKVLVNKAAASKLEKGATLEQAELYISTPEQTINIKIGAIRTLLSEIKSLRPSTDQVERLKSDLNSFVISVEK